MENTQCLPAGSSFLLPITTGLVDACSLPGNRVSRCPFPSQVLLYDPLFDWTMNPLKAFHLQHDEQQELNATLSSTMGGGGADDMVSNRKAGYVNAAGVLFLLSQEK